MNINITKEDVISLLLQKTLDVRQVARIKTICGDVLTINPIANYKQLEIAWNEDNVTKLEDETITKIYELTKEIPIDFSIRGQFLYATSKEDNSKVFVVMTIPDENVIAIRSSTNQEIEIGLQLDINSYDFTPYLDCDRQFLVNSNFNRRFIKKQEELQQNLMADLQEYRNRLSPLEFDNFINQDQPEISSPIVQKLFLSAVEVIVKANYKGMKVAEVRVKDVINFRELNISNLPQDFYEFFKKKNIKVLMTEFPSLIEYNFSWK